MFIGWKCDDFICHIGTEVIRSIDGEDSCDGVVAVDNEEVCACCCHYFVKRLLIRTLGCFKRYCYYILSFVDITIKTCFIVHTYIPFNMPS